MKEHSFFEAASIRYFDGYYFLVYSSLQGHELCYCRSKYPDNDFTYMGRLISNADMDDKGRIYYPKGNNHGSICKIKDDYYLFYHRHTLDNSYHRETCVEKLPYHDHMFDEVKMTSLGFSSPFQLGDEIQAISTVHLYKDGRPCDTMVKHTKEEVFVTHINKNTQLLYRYCDFSHVNKLQFKVRGSFKGKMKLSTSLTSQEVPLEVHSSTWTIIESPNTLKGLKEAFKCHFEGKGTLDMLTIKLC